jgi:hypothetical protein
LNSFNFDPSYVPPGIKLRLHRNGTKWRTDPEPVNLKRFGPKVEPAKEPPLKKSKTENSKNLKNSNLQKSKKRNLESIMAKIEEARERKISSESNTTPEKNVRKPAPSGDENKNNSKINRLQVWSLILAISFGVDILDVQHGRQLLSTLHL